MDEQKEGCAALEVFDAIDVYMTNAVLLQKYAPILKVADLLSEVANYPGHPLREPLARFTQAACQGTAVFESDPHYMDKLRELLIKAGLIETKVVLLVGDWVHIGQVTTYGQLVLPRLLKIAGIDYPTEHNRRPGAALADYRRATWDLYVHATSNSKHGLEPSALVYFCTPDDYVAIGDTPIYVADGLSIYYNASVCAVCVTKPEAWDSDPHLIKIRDALRELAAHVVFTPGPHQNVPSFVTRLRKVASWKVEDRQA